jgi:hypothetical protein
MSKQPHISHPLDDARRLINHANHHCYRAMHMDTAYEIKRALEQLNSARVILQRIQQDYPIASPETIDTSKRPNDPTLAPESEQR